MPGRPPRVCLRPGCGAIGDWPRGYCPEDDARPAEAIDRLYNSAAYKRFRARLRSENPICQKLTLGQQCHNAGAVLHHVIAPTSMTELLDPKRCVMLCTGHHPGGKAGTPTWREGIDFVPTIFTVGM